MRRLWRRLSWPIVRDMKKSGFLKIFTNATWRGIKQSFKAPMPGIREM